MTDSEGVIIPYAQSTMDVDPLVERVNRFVELQMPFRIGPDGAVGAIRDPALAMSQRIETIICTRLRERLMRPRFGTTVYDKVLDVASPEVGSRIQQEIEQALHREEPSLLTQSVRVVPQKNFFEITVLYSMPPLPGVFSVSPTFPTFSESSNG